jgi:hypothetical protein
MAGGVAVILNPKYGKLFALLGGMYAYRHNVDEWSQVHSAVASSYAYGGFLAGAAMGWLLAAMTATMLRPWRSEKANG